MNTNDRQARFAEILGRWEGKLRADALRMARGNVHLAEDVLQQTLTKAWASFDQLREPEAAGKWLGLILHGCYVDTIRRTRDGTSTVKEPCDLAIQSRRIDAEESEALVAGLRQQFPAKYAAYLRAVLECGSDAPEELAPRLDMEPDQVRGLKQSVVKMLDARMGMGHWPTYSKALEAFLQEPNAANARALLGLTTPRLAFTTIGILLAHRLEKLRRILRSSSPADALAARAQRQARIIRRLAQRYDRINPAIELFPCERDHLRARQAIEWCVSCARAVVRCVTHDSTTEERRDLRKSISEAFDWLSNFACYLVDPSPADIRRVLESE